VAAVVAVVVAHPGVEDAVVVVVGVVVAEHLVVDVAAVQIGEGLVIIQAERLLSTKLESVRLCLLLKLLSVRRNCYLLNKCCRFHFAPKSVSCDGLIRKWLS
jgi:hypothetical protein